MYPPIEIELNTSTYVVGKLPANHGCNAHSLWTEDGKAYYYATDADGSDGILVTSDGTSCLAQSLDITYAPDASGTIIGYFKGTTATNLVGRITKR